MLRSVAIDMMESFFDDAATKVVFEYAANDVVVSVIWHRPEGLQWTDIDVRSEGFRRQVKDALSCGGTKEICVDCAVIWSQRVVLGLHSVEGPVAVAARLHRVQGEATFHPLPCKGLSIAGVKAS